MIIISKILQAFVQWINDQLFIDCQHCQQNTINRLNHLQIGFLYYYYRIKSIKVEEPIWMRIFDLANVRVLTSDPYQKEILLHAVPKGAVDRPLDCFDLLKVSRYDKNWMINWSRLNTSLTKCKSFCQIVKRLHFDTLSLPTVFK